MKALISLASEFQKYFEENQWKFCFIGGIALQQWGEPRLTNYIDISLLTGFGAEEVFIDRILSIYESRVENGKEFALKSRVLLLKASSGIGIDIALAGLPFEEDVFKRSLNKEFLPGIFLRVCTAEDLIIFKAFADRSRDWSDLDGILIRQRSHLDWSNIQKQLTPLCVVKEAPHILPRLEKMRKELTLE